MDIRTATWMDIIRREQTEDQARRVAINAANRAAGESGVFAPGVKQRQITDAMDYWRSLQR